VASVERYRGRWRTRWYDESGAHKSRSFDRKVDAERWLHEVEHKLAVGTYIDPSAGRITFGEYLDEWLALRMWRASTRDQAESYLRRHVRPTFERRQLAAIRPSEVQAWVKRLADELAPATVELVFTYFRTVMKAAVTDRLLATSPCVGIRLPKRERPKVVPLEVEQVEAIAAAAPERYRAAIVLAAATGLRSSEVFGLTLGNVHLLRRQLAVEQQLVTRTGSPPQLGPPKTAASHRTVPLPQLAIDALATHLARWPVTHEWGLVFTTDRGTPVQRHRVAAMFNVAAAEAGLPGVTFHATRHHYASLLIRAGCSVKVVQNRLGHASATETLDTYSHLWPDDEERTRAAVDEAWQREVPYLTRTSPGL
jgi:integrase